jgi:hypothetical protein
MSLRLFAILVTASTVLLAGCADGFLPASEVPAVGTECTIQFRRDVLGGGAMGLPIAPTVPGMNGADVSASGILLKLNPEWVLLQTSAYRLWIPRRNILLIEFPKE